MWAPPPPPLSLRFFSSGAAIAALRGLQHNTSVLYALEELICHCTGMVMHRRRWCNCCVCVFLVCSLLCADGALSLN